MMINKNEQTQANSIWRKDRLAPKARRRDRQEPGREGARQKEGMEISAGGQAPRSGEGEDDSHTEAVPGAMGRSNVAGN